MTWTIKFLGCTLTLHEDGTVESQGTPTGLDVYVEPGKIVEVYPADEGDVIVLHE